MLGMVAVLLLGDKIESVSMKRKIAAILFLALSLCTKHILFAFPLWLALKHKRFSDKILFLSVPLFLFVLSFAPYWHAGHDGIIKNVFLYNSVPSGYLYKLLMPWCMHFVLSPRNLWFAILFFAAFYFRREKPLTSLLLYTSIVVVASPSIINHYLSIIAPFVAVYFNPFFGIYILGTIWLMITDSDELYIIKFMNNQYDTNLSVTYFSLVVLLCAGIAWMLWKNTIIVFLRAVYTEIAHQIGSLIKSGQ
jgi:hypothetical protein